MSILSPRSVQTEGLTIDASLYEFIANEVLPGLEIASSKFWHGFSSILHELGPKNRTLLAKRDEMQAKIESWHSKNGALADLEAYQSFLRQIGYPLPEGSDFKVSTSNVDTEIASIAGPQLVVPVMNARYALNAANARWGSLYDALYGTDAIPETDGAEKGRGYNPKRGEKVIAWVHDFLDDAVPLDGGSWKDVGSLKVEGGKLAIADTDGETHALKDAAHFAGYRGSAAVPTHILLKNNGIHIEIVIDAETAIGKADPAHISDVWLESAITTIMDCEDSVAAVDAEDKVVVYRNWLGLMKGDLQEGVPNGGSTFIRKLNPDTNITAPDGSVFELHRRSLILVRNVGHLMTNPAILDRDGSEVPEGIMDAVITGPIALYDVGPRGRRKNSREGSMYVVKPKMHGPDEVAFASEIFGRVEPLLGMPAQHHEDGHHGRGAPHHRQPQGMHPRCPRACRLHQHRLPRSHRRRDPYLVRSRPDDPQGRHEAGGVDFGLRELERRYGLECGLSGHAQIGKGMWAMPDLMAAMLEQKIAHPKAGSNTAWVPSPTAATLHATHYHRVNVAEVQAGLKSRSRAKLADILSVPVAPRPNWAEEEIQRELDNNAQGILGYVVRRVDHGVGCSKVPDINNVGLMEDRATLRISAQHMANWLHHGIVSEAQIVETMKRMAAVVDEQNANDENYTPWPAASTSRSLSRPPSISCSRAASSRTAIPGRSCTAAALNLS